MAIGTPSEAPPTRPIKTVILQIVSQGRAAREGPLKVLVQLLSPDGQHAPLPAMQREIMPARLVSLLPDLAAYGRALTAMLFEGSPLRGAWALCAQGCGPDGALLELLLEQHPSGDDGLEDLHWETLWDPARLNAQEVPPPLLAYQEWLLFARRPRQLPSIERATAPALPRALVVISSPAGLAAYRLSEIDVLQQILYARKALLGAEIRVLASGTPAPPTLRAIERELADSTPFDIVYILCHGRADGDSHGLFLENEAGQAVPVNTTAIAGCFGRQRPPRLVVVLACQSGDAPGANGSIGSILTGAGVPAVLVLRGMMPIAAANAFASGFLDQLLAGQPVPAAVRQGRRQMGDAPDLWARPILYLAGNVAMVSQPERFVQRRSAIVLTLKSLARQRKGGLGGQELRLRDWQPLFEQATRAVDQQLRRAETRAASPLEALRERLDSILERVSPGLIDQLFRDTLAHWNMPSRRPERLGRRALVNELDSLLGDSDDGTRLRRGLFTFVDGLAARKPDLEVALRRWRAAYCKALGWDQAHVPGDPPPTPPADEFLYVAVVLEVLHGVRANGKMSRADLKKLRFGLSIHKLVGDGMNLTPSGPSLPEQGYTLAELNNVVRGLIVQLRDELYPPDEGPARKLVIEFVVPRSLIDWPFERELTVEVEFEQPLPLGQSHGVVVRPVRLRDGGLPSNYRHLGRFRDGGAANFTADEVVVRRDEAARQVGGKRAPTSDIRPAVHALIIPDALRTLPPIERCPITQAITSGVSIVIWPREHRARSNRADRAAEEFPAEDFCSILTAHSPHHPPFEAFRQRRDKPFDDAFVVLWDDPSRRIPTPPRARVPEQHP